MSAPHDLRDLLPPFLRRYCPSKQQCRLWSAKCSSVLYHWLARFGKACARGWTALVRTSRPFVANAAKRWRQLDRKWQVWSICTLLAALFLPLLFAFNGRGTGPAVGSSEASNARGAATVKNGNAPAPHTDARFRYTVTDLGTLGGEASKAYGISNTGQVVGQATTKRSEEHAFLWQASSGMFDILGQEGSIAFGINNSGQVVGGVAASSSEREVHPFLWEASRGMQDLGTLGGRETIAFGINNSGQVVGQATTKNNEEHAFVWNATTRMFDPIGRKASIAFGINDANQVVGGTTTKSGEEGYPFLWEASRGMQDLGTFGGKGSIAFGVNNSGQVVGGAMTKSGDVHAFLWQASHGMLDLGMLGGIGTIAFGINKSGQIVGKTTTQTLQGLDAFLNVSGEELAFLYTDGKMIDLNTMIDPASGWHLSNAAAINDLGQIVGSGINKAGQSHAFLLTPVPGSRVTADAKPSPESATQTPAKSQTTPNTLYGPAYGPIRKKTLKDSARAQIGLLESAVDFYHLDVGDYPQNLEALRAQRAGLPQNKWAGPYLKRDVPLDPWNKQYIYQYPGQHNPDSYDISTTTPEGEVIGNWTAGTKQ